MQRASKLLNYHKDQPLIQCARNDIKTPVTVDVLHGYSNDETLQKQTGSYVFGKDYLLMPLMVSPLWCYIRGAVDKWVPMYSDSLATVSNFRMVIECYIRNPVPLPYYKKNQERIENAYDEFLNRMSDLDEKKKIHIHQTARAYKEKQKNEKQTLEAFIGYMEKYTFDFINAMETLIIISFDLKPHLESLLTPHVSCSINVLNPKDRDTVPKMTCHYFGHKQAYRNGQLALQHNEGEFKDVEYFDLEDMETRLQQFPPEEIYQGYLDRVTAMEYLKYMDT